MVFLIQFYISKRISLTSEFSLMPVSKAFSSVTALVMGIPLLGFRSLHTVLYKIVSVWQHFKTLLLLMIVKCDH